MAEQQHESQEPNLRGLLVAGAIISVAIVLAIGVGLWLVSLFGGFERPLARAEHNPMPEPHLQPYPLSDRRHYDEQQRAKLSAYQWVDRNTGIVRIPIDRALQIIARQGGTTAAHGAPPTPNQAPAPKARGTP